MLSFLSLSNDTCLLTHTLFMQRLLVSIIANNLYLSTAINKEIVLTFECRSWKPCLSVNQTKPDCWQTERCSWISVDTNRRQQVLACWHARGIQAPTIVSKEKSNRSLECLRLKDLKWADTSALAETTGIFDLMMNSQPLGTHNKKFALQTTIGSLFGLSTNVWLLLHRLRLQIEGGAKSWHC